MDEQRIQHLLRKYGRQECTPEETTALQQWYASLGQEATAPFGDAAAETVMQEQLWRQISEARQPARRFRLPVWARVAAVALPLAIAALLLYNNNLPAPHQPLAAGHTAGATTVSTPYGSIRRVTLPDGTEVQLNAGSELQYGEAFNDTKREVTLSGEAYFDVKADAEKPFIIHTGKMNIRVLGTAFNVKAYPNDPTTEASLIRGAIEVTPAGQPRRKIILRPNEKIVLPNLVLTASPGTLLPEAFEALQQQGYALATVSVNPADSTVAETAWLSNRLAFMNENFAEIALRLERKFEMNIVFEDAEAAQLRFTATFENENIRQTLEALQFTAPFKFRIDKKTIYITR